MFAAFTYGRQRQYSLTPRRPRNHNLEVQAQALFKSWFVDFEPFKEGKFVDSELGLIPEGWGVYRVGDLPLYIADYVANGSFASLKENVKLYESENYAVFIRNTVVSPLKRRNRRSICAI